MSALTAFAVGLAVGGCAAFLLQGVVFLWLNHSRPTSLERSWQRAKGGES